MRGHIRKVNNTWYLVFDIGRSEDGKRKQKWVPFHGTKKEAERELARLLCQVESGSFIDISRMTVGEYLERWLATDAKMRVALKTHERYEEIVRKHLIPGLGGIRLMKLNTLHVKSYYADALERGRLDGKGGLSKQTVLHLHGVLHKALQDAVRSRLIPYNPADAARPGKPDTKEIKLLTTSEVKIVLDAAKGSRIYLPILVAYTTGMRRGEILAMRWTYLNLDAGRYSVNQALQETRDGLTFKTPKTQKGRREIALPAITVDALRRHKAQQNEERLRLGPEYHDQGLIITMENGEPWKPSLFSNSFKYLMNDRLRIKGVTFHSLRHLHASTLLAAGNIHPKIVSERLGHASVGITLDLYSHILPNLQQEAAAVIDKVLGDVSREDEY